MKGKETEIFTFAEVRFRHGAVNPPSAPPSSSSSKVVNGEREALICHERDEELKQKQKLEDAKQEIETMKNVKLKLLNLLNMAYQERDEARFQLQKLVNTVMQFDGVVHNNNNNNNNNNIL
ncbi:hypothetical protein PIB30_025596 [Stylosanthes scabra]|uniref:Uncharacterized protein n=1 Tax=Stylosanthes scabra TaxID=79078 RepID=A0ABU6SBG9_9FABA|nr:hypothetical protein [Stylosanthes scabra]